MLKAGDKVTYLARHKIERGIVKFNQKKGDLAVFVVYYCNKEWDKFNDYTSALTHLDDLIEGWILPDTNELNYEKDK